MRSTPQSSKAVPITSTTSQTQTSCPLCGGTLIDLRGMRRCLRCSFVICEGCESWNESEEGEASPI
jgi:hypothetical protein